MDNKPDLRIVDQSPWSDPRGFHRHTGLTDRERSALNASGYREPVLDRAARAFGSERTFFFILGGYVGALLTMALAFVWALVLK